MSWSIGYDEKWKRDIGYGVPAVCDHPDCTEKIDRGLSYVCGGEPYGGDDGCGLYFCEAHLRMGRCERCTDAPCLQTVEHAIEDCDESISLDAALELLSVLGIEVGPASEPFEKKPDVEEWVRHKLTDESWAEWRAENLEEVEKMKARVCA